MILTFKKLDTSGFGTVFGSSETGSRLHIKIEPDSEHCLAVRVRIRLSSCSTLPLS